MALPGRHCVAGFDRTLALIVPFTHQQPQTASDNSPGHKGSQPVQTLWCSNSNMLLTQLAHRTSLGTTRQHKRLATAAQAQRTHVSSGKAAGATPVLAATAPNQLTISPAEQQQHHQAPEQPSSIKFSKRQLLTFGCACCLALQAQQQQPAAADSGHFSYSGAHTWLLLQHHPQQGVQGSSTLPIAAMFCSQLEWFSWGKLPQQPEH
jgi:hypothetical protein